MVVAVVTVRVVQMAVHQVLDMVAMRHGLMTAIWPVYMTCGVAVALVGRRAAIRVEGIYRQAVLVDVIAMHMVQVTIVQIVNMAIVLNRRMATARLVLMVMIGMLRAGTHVDGLF
ncbi:hypothetical protein HU732_03850 [Pseudomonas proteolytica]|uniref:hypothetical protein n=1 Tax=Pseudomonas proteolytica TaxID=219574 RepID=UPI0016482AC5|nr:hypothetical protein [Pseudomonas proteolytica]MBC3335410.1 hypothetical protein [Pseudomonas proteolytica]